MQTIVIGHKNPDMDSICSAIAYAELKRKLGAPDVIAARAGNTNERIDLVLQKFGVPAPEFVSDVSATVADVMETERSEEHTSELQSHSDLVCRLLLEKKKNMSRQHTDVAGSLTNTTLHTSDDSRSSVMV